MTEKSFQALRRYCEREEYKGWDPYDGLNSRIFQATPFKHWDIARLVLIQLLKRSPVNFRKLLLVPRQYNAKAIGLFLNGYVNLLQLARSGDDRFGDAESLEGQVREVADLLVSLQSEGYSGACWGYNFDWQARRLFLFPAHTPTVVATTFCATALFRAFEATGEEQWREIALSSADFVMKDLHRTPHSGGFMLSYSPLKGNDTVYNASLLGAKLLSYCYDHSGRQEYRAMARDIVNAACEGQLEDGSWVYGLLPVQSWIDSFHTGYNLDALAAYAERCDDRSYEHCLEKGFDFYVRHFFLPDGTPKYYHDRVYPIDIHCPGQLWVTVSALDRWREQAALCRRVADWTIDHMQDDAGYFYYQLKRGISSRIPYMRWSNAFMFNALSYYLLEENGIKDH